MPLGIPVGERMEGRLEVGDRTLEEERDDVEWKPGGALETERGQDVKM